jgi:YidC/Oxa1 family membrane protein insertase
MEKRALIAIVLSMLVLMIYSSFMAKVAPPPSAPVAKTISQGPIETVKDLSTPKPILETPTSFAEIETAKYQLRFALPRAGLWEASIKDYKKTYLLKNAFLAQFAQEPAFQFQAKEQGGVFTSQDSNKIITQTVTTSNSNYTIELELSIHNLTNAPLNLAHKIFLGTIKLDDRLWELCFFKENKIERKNLGAYQKEYLQLPEAQAIGVCDRYFCILAKTDAPAAGFVQRISPQEVVVGIESPITQLSANQEVREKFLIYFGPQEIKFLTLAQTGWEETVNFGFFHPISLLFIWLLQFFHKITFNWGLATIGLSVCIFFLFYPLTLKQLRSMRDMQAMQPEIAALRTQYKNNPQKLNTEIMALYRKHKINPLGGCLPLVVQIPIFFALYQALMRSLHLRGASFLWIKDLSEPDRLFILPKTLPVIGNEINLLPILMAIAMFFQQKISMKASMGQAQEQQRMMLILMPIMFGFIFYHFPAGLGLYWFVYTGLSVIFQLKTAAATT